MNDVRLASNVTDIGQELLAQGDWLRGLARSLVSDADLAEDLVQETSLSALRAKPSTAGGLRSWLSTVMRNEARSRHRHERERRWREQVASRMEGTPSASYVVERASVQQRVVACVMGLGEPYRQTILLRYLDELSPAAIAAQMRVPVSTVKSRLSRGMEQLRERLDKNHEGDREAWLSAVGALAQVEGRSWFVKGGVAAGVLAIGAAGAYLAREHVIPEPRPASPTDLPLAQPVALVSERVEIASAPAVISNETKESAGDTSSSEQEARTRRTIRSQGQSPPGLLYVPAGEAWKEGDYDALEAQLLSALGANSPLSQWVAAMKERGGHVDEFHLMPTEVTNEQYYEFVMQTGARPPITWAGLRLRSFENERERRHGSIRTLETAFGQSDLDAEAWWDEQWKLVKWKLPNDIALLPVVGVTQSEAQSYAAWAGLRLPTALEYARASLAESAGITRRSKRTKRREPVRIQSMEDPELEEVGAFSTGNGFYDLAGNAREWIQSDVAFDETLSVEAMQQELELLTAGMPQELGAELSWPLASGGLKLDPMPLMASVRAQDSSSTQDSIDLRGNALGFRCAVSSDPTLDVARNVLSRLSPEAWPRDSRGELSYSPEAAIGVHRWKTGRGNRKLKLDGYEVIEGFEFVQFIPVLQVPADSPNEVREPAGALSPLHLGLLSTNLDLAEPYLPAGTYSIVMWRSASYSNRGTEPMGNSTAKDRVAFLRVSEGTGNSYGGPARAVVAVSGLDFENDNLDSRRSPVIVETRAPNGRSFSESVDRVLELPLILLTRTRQVLKLTLELRLADDALAGDWLSR